MFNFHAASTFTFPMEMIENGNLVGSINGTVFGDCDLAPGKKGLALYINGMDQYVEFELQGDTCLGYFVFCTHGWVMALWVKHGNAIYRRATVMDAGYNAYYGVTIYFYRGIMKACFSTVSKGWCVGAAPASTYNWFHIVATWQQCYGTKLYFDGELVDTYTHQYIESGPARGSPRFVLGTSYRHFFNFVGYLDELRVWDTVMSDEDVSVLYKVDAGLN